MPNLANLDYAARLNRAIDHITQNLGDDLKLELVARVAGFSPFHFHRIFKAEVGETLQHFVKRLRLERAVYLRSHSPGTPLTELALRCGFSSSSDFSRSFRKHFGVAPRDFDVTGYRSQRRASWREQVEALRAAPAKTATQDCPWQVQIRDYPARHVAYIRVCKPYEGAAVREAATRLLAWARERDLANGQWLGYQWDDPDIVALPDCRYDIAVEVPVGLAGDGEVCIQRFPSMRLAEIEIAGSIEQELQALDWLYGTWLPNSGYEPADQPGFEAFHGPPFAHGDNYFELRIQLPILRGLCT